MVAALCAEARHWHCTVNHHTSAGLLNSMMLAEGHISSFDEISTSLRHSFLYQDSNKVQHICLLLSSILNTKAEQAGADLILYEALPIVTVGMDCRPRFRVLSVTLISRASINSWGPSTATLRTSSVEMLMLPGKESAVSMAAQYCHQSNWLLPNAVCTKCMICKHAWSQTLLLINAIAGA